MNRPVVRWANDATGEIKERAFAGTDYHATYVDDWELGPLDQALALVPDIVHAIEVAREHGKSLEIHAHEVEPIDATPEQINRVGRPLAAAARVAYLGRELIGADDVLRQLTSEVSGVLDILSGLAITNPEQRLDAHMRRIAELSAELPQLDQVAAQ